MKLQQLRYFDAVAENGLNISAAAARLYTSQPGISKQLKLLEEELGVALFQRCGRSLTRLTPAGHKVLDGAQRVLQEISNIRQAASDLREEGEGMLSIATTHTQARYVLPSVIERFRQAYPAVQLELHQGTAEQIDTLFAAGQVDLIIASGNKPPDGAVTFPCYDWHPLVVVPMNHPLAANGEIDIHQLAAYPLITYSFNTRADSSLLKPFRDAGLQPDVALTARDADIIKTYVKRGLGIGIIASMAFEPDVDSDLAPINADRLFPKITTWIGFRRGAYLPGCASAFVDYLAPQLRSEIAAELSYPREVH
ncbi:MAG: LysR substrate-binding domain-containing protein [Gammaproteobacteria bacterium]